MAEVVLWHIPFSNFSEKARWALDYKAAAACPALVALRPAPTGRAGPDAWAPPVLQIGGRALGDSTANIAELERRYPEPPIYPFDPSERTRALELEEFFDENYGHEVRRLAFWHLLSDD
jgi:glutathione S-transferase